MTNQKITHLRLPEYAVLANLEKIINGEEKIFIIHPESYTIALLLEDDYITNPKYDEYTFLSKNGKKLAVFKSQYEICNREQLQKIINGMGYYIEYIRKNI